ncbi:c-type cytochrome biogenesis protein CcmI [Rhodoblastus acidophilus]|uniref:C-type cytochrome biogenesis protein CcmI n=1 Tax=Candidatus Rhodoblastus alkanivorans TaxID=2954117 RepID=A0ABS9Z469_9HYPH|nr:c-type cytochrome biogenesis protein CcmI [Candidatus Rhodoblastus alkanivorans]MCI4678771.1 c-type cytochrome biogenesis protein CcmI [Candidatus Rhodoblastus alkanivorans]MCI4682160.1 c-type cytochrome biogenesis protein CcmI [Candidatus Rhodoblastus alkanivorans]MDI4639462.1 c-type cytochrome biogenesis protein CcmI [Rhodoblastus acidophilus]
MIWLVFALLTGAAVLSILWPLSRPAPRAREDAADVAFYRAQIAEIDAEFARGGVDKDQAEAAKALAARRLLAVAPEEAGTESSPRGRRIAAVLALIVIPAVALGLYSRIGHPSLPDMPLQARLSAPPSQQDFAAVVERMEDHIKAHPDDARALELMAPVYVRMGRFDEAVQARKKVIALLGATPDRLLKYAEALAFANNGTITPEAIAQLQQALKLDPKNIGARFYLGLAAAQQGDNGKARKIWTALLPDLPEKSLAHKEVAEKLALLDAPAEATGAPSGEAAAIASAAPAEQQKMIRTMVERLAQRLAAQGGSPDEWLRLIRAYKVLNETDKAQNSYNEALKALSGDTAAREKLAALARQLGLNPQ